MKLESKRIYTITPAQLQEIISTVLPEDEVVTYLDFNYTYLNGSEEPTVTSVIVETYPKIEV